jgi:hypothetical protein
MIHAVTIHEDVPLLHLRKDDVLLIDDEGIVVELYRPMDWSYAGIIPALLEQGVATSSLSADAVALVASGHRGPGPDGSSLVPRSGLDRRRLHLRLEA